MGTRSDRERKLAADAGFTMPEFAGEPLAERTFTSTYHDTEDMRLARAGIVLRRRVEDGTQAWQLKLPRGRRRLEVDLPGDAEESPAELVELLFAHTRGMDVTAVAALRVIRSGVQVHEGERRVADVISDRLAVVEGDVVTDRPGDLEIALVDGDDEELGQIEARLRDAGARDADRRSKLERALGLTRSEPPAPTDEAPTPADRLLAVVGTQYRVILANDPGTRRGDDPEYLHQHRVAVRRLRSVLRAAAPMLDAKWTRKLRDELKWAGYALGPVRDLDVMIEHLEGEIGELPEQSGAEPLIASLREEHDEARAQMLEALRSKRYVKLLDRLERASAALPIVNTGVSLTALAAKEFRKVQKAMAALGPLPPDDQLHEARIKVKRLRYTAELAAPFGGPALDAVVTETRHVQDLLGEHQDAHVAEERVRTLLSPELSAASHLAARRLMEREHNRRRAIRRQVPDAWAALEAAGAAAF